MDAAELKAYWKKQRAEYAPIVEPVIEKVLRANHGGRPGRDFSVGMMAEMVRDYPSSDFDFLPKRHQYLICRAILERFRRAGKVERCLGLNWDGREVKTYDWVE